MFATFYVELEDFNKPAGSIVTAYIHDPRYYGDDSRFVRKIYLPNNVNTEKRFTVKFADENEIIDGKFHIIGTNIKQMISDEDINNLVNEVRITRRDFNKPAGSNVKVMEICYRSTCGFCMISGKWPFNSNTPCPVCKGKGCTTEHTYVKIELPKHINETDVFEIYYAKSHCRLHGKFVVVDNL